MDNNIYRIGSRVFYSQGMREMGAARYILGGAILLFGLYFIWLGIIAVGLLVSLFAIILVEHCSKTIIDKENSLLIKKAGWINPFLTLKKQSIASAVSVSVETVSSARRKTSQVARRIRISNKLYIEMPDKKLHINTFTEKTQANAFATEIAKLLEIEFVKVKSKTKMPEND